MSESELEVGPYRRWGRVVDKAAMQACADVHEFGHTHTRTLRHCGFSDSSLALLWVFGRERICLSCKLDLSNMVLLSTYRKF